MKNDFRKLSSGFLNSYIVSFDQNDIKKMNDYIYERLTNGADIENIFADNGKIFIYSTMYKFNENEKRF